MVYDCFTFFNELDICEIRMEILNEVVDKFVVVEGTRTYSNNEKDLIFKKNVDRFSKFKDKIIYVEVNDWPEYENQYTYAHYQRNCVLNGLKNCLDDDIIILTDLDEIPNPDAVKKGIKRLRKTPGVLSFEMYLFYYYVNYFAYTKVYWLSQPKMFTFSELKKSHRSFSNDTGHNYFDVKTTPDQIRCMVDYFGTIHNGGWHFSTVGSLETICSFYKALVVADEIGAAGGHDLDRIQKYVTEGCVPRKTDVRMCSVNNRRLLPNYLLENKEKYKEMFTDLRPSEKIHNYKMTVLRLKIKKRLKVFYRDMRHYFGTLFKYQVRHKEIINKLG